MTTLQKAQQKYQESLRNYYAKKDIYEEYNMGRINMSKTESRMNEISMYHYNDILQTLTYIFGTEVRDA